MPAKTTTGTRCEIPGPTGRAGSSAAISGLGGSEWPVIVAMVPMRVMKAAVNEVIDMVSMRNRLVAAAWAVTVSITANLGCAFDGVGTADVDDVLVDLSVTGMMQAAVMKVVNVVAVADWHMSAVGAVPVCGAGHLQASRRR